MKRGKQVGIWGGSRVKKGWFRRALRLDAGRCGLPLRPSALHHSSCGLDTPALSGPALRRQRRPRPLGSVAAAASPPGSVAAVTTAAPALGVGTVAATAPRLSESAPWRREDPALSEPALLRIWLLWTRYRDGPSASCSTLWLSGPNASCPTPLFWHFRLAVRGIAPCDARCWLPDNWASMSLLAVLLKFARYA